ncbi:MAG: hypothetical protein K6E48_06525 [Lachnospiraceae bacterium]|nr:hypothetical protein [Lachnospiraceae bacterium]
MDAKKVKAGKTFIKAESPVDSFWYIAGGQVEATFPGGSITLGRGDLIGLSNLGGGEHSLTYTIKGDADLVPFGSPALLHSAGFFTEHADHVSHLAVGMNHQILLLLALNRTNWSLCNDLYSFVPKLYEKYSDICSEYHIVPRELSSMEEFEAPSPEHVLPNWMVSYHNGFHALIGSVAMRPTLEKVQILPGYLFYTSETISRILSHCIDMRDYCTNALQILINEERNDLFDLFVSAYSRIGAIGAQSAGIDTAIEELANKVKAIPSANITLLQSRLDEFHSIESSMMEEQEKATENPAEEDTSAEAQKLRGSLDAILEYADYLPEQAEVVRQHMSVYKALSDKSSSEPEAIRARKDLTEDFIQLYTACFQISLMEPEIPQIVKMFFNFGYMDPDLVGMENAKYLYAIAGSYSDMPEEGIYTMYHWLQAIYNGEKEPSVTELESNYEKYVQSLVTEGKLDKAGAAAMKENRAQKVTFELNNLFPTACKITNGHLATYCPVLSEHQFTKGASDTIQSAHEVKKLLDEIVKVDYSLFIHDKLTELNKKENIHDYFHVEIRPDIILTPVAGIRGAMWQEISGRSMLTPGRMLLPIFQMENLQKILYRMCGEYRWEFCKRVQGAHWNDVSEPSITSLYYDYLQFFRKNNELSPDAKEKIKLQIAKCKQNFREVFVMDYMIYMQFEAAGSPRMNKVARSIMFSQCPFSSDIRESIRSNPLYTDALHRYDIHTAQRKHFLVNLKQKLVNLNQPVPEALEEEMEYTGK